MGGLDNNNRGVFCTRHLEIGVKGDVVTAFNEGKMIRFSCEVGLDTTVKVETQVFGMGTCQVE